jgi:hypothetical protein
MLPSTPTSTTNAVATAQTITFYYAPHEFVCTLYTPASTAARSISLMQTTLSTRMQRFTTIFIGSIRPAPIDISEVVVNVCRAYLIGDFDMEFSEFFRDTIGVECKPYQHASHEEPGQ